MTIRNHKGVTLVELIIVMGLLTIVLASAFSVYMFSIRVHNKTVDEYEIQAATRLTAQHINHVTRYATATFTIPKSSFRPDNLTDGWSYIGVYDGDVVRFDFKHGSGSHEMTTIATGTDLVTYEIQFDVAADGENDNIVGYSINGFITGRPIEYDAFGRKVGHIHIDSQVEVLNSMQVIHKGTYLDPAVALAFRLDAREITQLQENMPIANIAFVLDRSGSMAWRMDGSTTSNDSLRRMTFLKTSANTLIDEFQAAEYPINISLVPFSTSANSPHNFLNVQSEATSLKQSINGLVPGGGTNTGDGLRRAYFQLINERSNPATQNRIRTEYLIVLVDGVTTYASYSNATTPITHANNINESNQVYGNGSSLDTAYGEPYVVTIGNMIKADNKIKVFVIGFSSRSTDLTSLSNIANSTGAEFNSETGLRYFEAGNEDELNVIFGDIQKIILNDLWYIDGPRL